MNHRSFHLCATSFGHCASTMASRRKKTLRVLELGPREAELLIALWRDGESTVNQLHEADYLGDVTVNTLHSTLERLYRKGFVERSRGHGRSYLYRPILQQSELISLCLHAVADRLAKGDRQLMLDGISAYLSDDKNI